MKLYKVIGDEISVKEYVLNNETCNDKLTDWSGIYFQMSIEHAITSIPYRWEKIYQIANLIEIETNIDKEYDIIKFNDAISYSNLTGYEKASWIKKKLNINQDELLIKWLEKNNKMIMIEEFENHHELIIPQSLIKDINFKEKIICIFEKSDRYPITKYFYTNDDLKTKIEYISDEKIIEMINKLQ